jgi:hypothetical protein
MQSVTIIHAKQIEVSHRFSQLHSFCMSYRSSFSVSVSVSKCCPVLRTDYVAKPHSHVCADSATDGITFYISQ